MHIKKCNRRDFLKITGLSAASLALPGCGNSYLSEEAKNPRSKPNIVLILADDQGWHQLGCYDNDFFETPNIDRLAEEGMKFTDAYSAAPVCSPTRASIMTGKYPARLHLTNFIPSSGIGDQSGRAKSKKKLLDPIWIGHLPVEEVTVAEALKKAGYTCGHFGKWHLSKDKRYKPGRPGDPASQGFDEVLTTHKAKPTDDPYNDAHHVKQITDRSIEFIRDNKDNPFFCYVTHNTIHTAEMEKAELIAKYQAKPNADNDKNKPVIAAMMETLDINVGRILNTLDELKLTENTIVIYFSDNGAGGNSNVLKPLRGAKANLYEGGIRVPMLVRWPGVVDQAALCGVPVISTDFFPTFLEAAGMKVDDPNVDGKNLIPLLKGAKQLDRDALYWHFPHRNGHGAIRAGKYKLIEWFFKSIDGIDTPGAIELYDLENDISEQNDLVNKMPKKANELYRKLRQWRKDVGAQDMPRNPNFKT